MQRRKEREGQSVAGEVADLLVQRVGVPVLSQLWGTRRQMEVLDERLRIDTERRTLLSRGQEELLDKTDAVAKALRAALCLCALVPRVKLHQ